MKHIFVINPVAGKGKAVNAYVADDKKNLSNLSKYAKEMKVYKKVMDLMEVLLNG